MPEIFEESETGELIKKPLLIIVRTFLEETLLLTDTYQFLEFKSEFQQLVKFPTYFSIFGHVFYFETEEAFANIFSIHVLPTKFLHLSVKNSNRLADIFPITLVEVE